MSNLDSYKGRTYGATIGFDIELKEDVLGVDSNTRTHFKLTTLVMIMQAHDHTFSFYGQESIGNGFLMQGLITVAQNNVSIRAIRQINNVNHNVTGKYKNHSINLEALLHYRLSDIMPTINITIIPNIGVRYGTSKDGVYNESNIGMQNFSATIKAQKILTGILRSADHFTSMESNRFNNNNPLLYASVDKHFNSKKQRLISKVTWQGG